MKFEVVLRIRLWQKLICDTINWTTRVLLKVIPNMQITQFVLLKQNDVIYIVLLLRVITEPSFNFIPSSEIKIYRGA